MTKTTKSSWTWAKFKAAIESQGVTENDEVAYIDWRENDAPTVCRYEASHGFCFWVE